MLYKTHNFTFTKTTTFYSQNGQQQIQEQKQLFFFYQIFLSYNLKNQRCFGEKESLDQLKWLITIVFGNRK